MCTISVCTAWNFSALRIIQQGKLINRLTKQKAGVEWIQRLALGIRRNINTVVIQNELYIMLKKKLSNINLTIELNQTGKSSTNINYYDRQVRRKEILFHWKPTSEHFRSTVSWNGSIVEYGNLSSLRSAPKMHVSHGLSYRNVQDFSS